MRSGPSLRQFVREGAHGVGTGHRGQVRLDVGAPEAVDRLLGVTDHRHAALVEHRSDDAPLDGVGVLGFVDESDGVPSLEKPAGGVTDLRIGEGVASLDQAVVEDDLACDPQTTLHLVAHAVGQLGPRASDPVTSSTSGTIRASGVPTDGLADLLEERHLGFFVARRVLGEAGHDEIAGDLGEQLVVDVAPVRDPATPWTGTPGGPSRRMAKPWMVKIWASSKWVNASLRRRTASLLAAASAARQAWE